MFFRMPVARSLLLLSGAYCALAVPAYANQSAQSQGVSNQAVMKNFLNRMKLGYARANAFMDSAGLDDGRIDLRGLPDGEILILSFRLNDASVLDGTVFAEIQNRQIYLSLNDLTTLFEFPINYDRDTQVYSGWFIRENMDFTYDVGSGDVVRNGEALNVLPRDVLIKDDDVYVARAVLENWFGLTLEPRVSEQYMLLDADPPLPIMERIARRKYQVREDVNKPASLPRGKDDYKAIGLPRADVSTRSTYRNQENTDPEYDHFVNLRTSGEFAYGTLSTNISGNDEEQITNARVTYMRESNEPELLGPLKARRFELGDVRTTRVPITGGSFPETGVRITNVDPLVRQTLPSTQISGYIFPGWDVELYRENSLLRFTETDDSGYYSFDDVRLFSNRNNFRVVAYGPQGETREEIVNVPYDINREARSGSVYDVSLSLQNRQAYQKFDPNDQDKDTPHFVGFFETPITDRTALRLGARYRQEEGEQKAYASPGVSTAIGEGLFNATVATDEDAELASELVYTRQFGSHNFRGSLDLATDEYNPGGSPNRNVRTLSNRYSLEGPFPIQIGDRPRYLGSVTYNEDADGGDSIIGAANFNTTHKRLGFNQSFLYSDDSDLPGDPLINSSTSITGSRGRDTYRLRTNFEISPESELDSLFASWRRRITPDLESQLELGHTLDTDVTRLSGQLNWRPEFATISPRFTYDSDGNVEATLNTRFGVLPKTDPGGIVLTRDFVTGNGTISAFVYLDKNGNKKYDGNDEPIPDARVSTPQNGKGELTDENGFTFINQLRPNILTDVYVDQGTLTDPYWIPAEEGVSILPRTGTNVSVEFPVHVSGEIDGSVYVRTSSGSTSALRGITLYLYNEDGDIEQKTKTEADGFYLFSLVPPGRYALSIADAGMPKNMRRPRPQFIEIGYDGTTIFGNDIFVKADTPDIPNEIIADLDDYRAYHPHINFDQSDYKIALNLGSYKSRLLTSFMWYRLKTRYAQILDGTQIYVPPSQSYAMPKTGEHILRVGLASESLDDAYNRCKALVARGLYCKVEVYPTAKQQKMAAVSD